MVTLKFIRYVFLFFGLALIPMNNYAEGQDKFSQILLKNFTYRNLGPFRSGSWISDFAVPESPPEAHLYTFYVAGRNGGLWKTTNNGTTFEPLFDEQDVFSIGDIALAPSNSDILWVGTGEHATARSSYWGDGVYKSINGGRTFQHMGLKDTHHIGRIEIHPTNPDIVYVAAEGHLFSDNEERGVFKTKDGGKTWEKVLYINEKIGVIDLALNNDRHNVHCKFRHTILVILWQPHQNGTSSPASSEFLDRPSCTFDGLLRQTQKTLL